MSGFPKFSLQVSAILLCEKPIWQFSVNKLSEVSPNHVLCSGKNMFGKEFVSGPDENLLNFPWLLLNNS